MAITVFLPCCELGACAPVAEQSPPCHETMPGEQPAADSPDHYCPACEEWAVADVEWPTVFLPLVPGVERVRPSWKVFQEPVILLPARPPAEPLFIQHRALLI